MVEAMVAAVEDMAAARVDMAVLVRPPATHAAVSVT